MGDLSNYLNIALGVVREGASIFNKNISNRKSYGPKHENSLFSAEKIVAKKVE